MTRLVMPAIVAGTAALSTFLGVALDEHTTVTFGAVTAVGSTVAVLTWQLSKHLYTIITNQKVFHSRFDMFEKQVEDRLKEVEKRFAGLRCQQPDCPEDRTRHHR